jgi:hypothetical protein
MLNKSILPSLVAKVKELGEKYPDAIYEKLPIEMGPQRCSYSKGKVINGPEREGCIIGQALVELGIDLECVKDNNSINNYFESCEEADWLCDVQDLQDRGKSWGEVQKYMASLTE